VNDTRVEVDLYNNELQFFLPPFAHHNSSSSARLFLPFRTKKRRRKSGH
jgi:hypothetical protein